MNKTRMRELIDAENGAGFSNNVNLDGYNFFKNNTFISFKISKINGIPLVNIKYIYSESKKDLINVLAYCCNYWYGSKVKFVYYKEKDKKPYAIKLLRSMGFTVLVGEYKKEWPVKFECNRCNKSKCECYINEAYI